MSLLNNLGDLKELNVSKNRLKNLEKFVNVEHLESVDAKFCQLTEINFLKNARQLKHLNLFTNRIKDIRILKDAKDMSLNPVCSIDRDSK